MPCATARTFAATSGQSAEIHGNPVEQRQAHRQGGLMPWTFHCHCGYVASSENGLPYDHEPVHGTCCNCSGVRCMGCVFREWDHECANDCPECDDARYA